MCGTWRGIHLQGTYSYHLGEGTVDFLMGGALAVIRGGLSTRKDSFYSLKVSHPPCS